MFRSVRVLLHVCTSYIDQITGEERLNYPCAEEVVIVRALSLPIGHSDELRLVLQTCCLEMFSYKIKCLHKFQIKIFNKESATRLMVIT